MTQDTREPDEKSDAGATCGEQPELRPDRPFIVVHWRLIVILLLSLAVAGMYLWKEIAVNRARAQLTERAGRIITEQNRSFIRHVAVPLVWAVRSEMIRDNLDQVDQYLTQFVKEQNMKEIVVATPDGTIVVATNKKLEGTHITAIFPPSVLQVDKTTVTSLENGDIMAVSPVMGLSAKLGTLVLVYTPMRYTLE